MPPQIHVIGTMVFVVAVGLVAVNTILSGRAATLDRRIAQQEAAAAQASAID